MHELNIIVNKHNKTEYLFQFVKPNILEFKNNYENVLSINIYLFDALSRFRFFTQMPDTNKYLNKLKRNFDIFSFELYHTIGVNSRPNFYPFFYGCYKDDIHPNMFLYSTFIKNNFSIISNLAECDKILAFYYLNRSSIINIKHNLQISCIAKVDYFSSSPRCVGSKQHHEWQLDYLEQSLKYYHSINKKSFSFTSFDEAHDPSFLSITRVDNDFANHLENLYSIIYSTY